MEQTAQLAYVVGVALGDGNLSRPNGRATRLRVTCDMTYPALITDITAAVHKLFPHNAVSHTTRTDHCVDISVYSNALNECMPWRVGKGSKYDQRAHVPAWILADNDCMKSCLKGLLQTDGSIYYDRAYPMVNFTNMTEVLVDDVFTIITQLGYAPKKYQTAQKNGTVKYVVRLSKKVDSFLYDVRPYKS